MPSQKPERIQADVAVVGGGPAGLTAAIALAAGGVDTLLVAPRPTPDRRTTALMAGSVAALEALEVWQHCRGHAEPLRAIRIVDDRGGLFHAPEVTFEAAEIGLDAFAHNIEQAHLTAALAHRAAERPSLRSIAAQAVALEATAPQAELTLADGAIVVARLVIGADGRNSLCRQAARIETDAWRYPQSALVCNLAHTRPHRNVSTEFHTAAGPFTLVPLPGERSSLVWVTAPEEAARLAALEDAALSRAIEQRAHSILGKTAVEPGRGVFPLAGLTARRFFGERIALVGEAAHVIPPIGAQGFNLGLRDALAIAECVINAKRQGEDPGSAEVLGRYAAMRRGDAQSRTLAVDALNRSLLTDFLPFQAARGFGLALLDAVPPLRRALMRAGVGPTPSDSLGRTP